MRMESKFLIRKTNGKADLYIVLSRIADMSKPPGCFAVAAFDRHLGFGHVSCERVIEGLRKFHCHNFTVQAY